MKYLPLILLILLPVILCLWDPVFAQQNKVASLIPENGDLKINEEKIVAVKLSSNSKISGFDLKFKTSGALIISDFVDSLSMQDDFDPFNERKVIKKIEDSVSQIAYVFTTEPQKLPSEVTVYIKVKGNASGEGKIELDTEKSQLLDEFGKLVKLSDVSATFNLNPNKSSVAFINSDQIPPVKYPESAAVINIKTRLYGAVNSTNRVGASVVAVGRTGEGRFETQPQAFYLTGNGDGTYSGQFAFPDFKDGNKFSLMLKIDNYLLKRICDQEVSENKPGGYYCHTPSLTIRSGEKVSLDFSKISILPGDLGIADGILNGYDLGIVRNNIGKEGKAAIALSDLNYDGVVDTKDFELIQFVAENSSRKADQ